jgi:aspartate aminotransferase-like enzyme
MCNSFGIVSVWFCSSRLKGFKNASQYQIFLVTGGGSGLVVATATTLVSSGAKVILADINRVAPQCRLRFRTR